MKKVLEVIPYSYLPYFSGGQKLVAKFVDFLGEETDLTVISTQTNDFSRAKTYKGLPWLRKSFFRYMDISLSWKIIALVKKEKFDAIIWEQPYYAWLAWLVKKRTGIRTIFHTHNIEYQRFRSIGKWWWPILKVYEKWCLGFSDFVFFITEEERAFAVTKWGIKSDKSMEITFGIDSREPVNDKDTCRQIIAGKHKIGGNETIILFNGHLSYQPNIDALLAVLNAINPHLLNTKGFQYKIIICGKDLPEYLNSLKEYETKNIIYAGFVDDIETYFKGANLFLNPVQTGGGIKTKMVEAIGFGTTVISTETGASGINRSVCGNKLVVIKDNDWNRFAQAILENKDDVFTTPPAYYQYYYWKNLIKKVLTAI